MGMNVSIKDDKITIYCSFTICFDSIDRIDFIDKKCKVLISFEYHDIDELKHALIRFNNQKNFKSKIDENNATISFKYSLSIKEYEKMKENIVCKFISRNTIINIIIDFTQMSKTNVIKTNIKKSKIKDKRICYNPKPYNGGKFSSK
ncbi:MAG: hypothetical protein IKK66_00260 [Ruminococcus sp.]|nr:hypothetical protein [Ruminococcus sp.]